MIVGLRRDRGNRGSRDEGYNRSVGHNHERIRGDLPREVVAVSERGMHP